MHSYRHNYFDYQCNVLDLYEKLLLDANAKKSIIHKKRLEAVLEALINELRYPKYNGYDVTFNKIIKNEKVKISSRFLIHNKNNEIKLRIFSLCILFKMKHLIKNYICNIILK